MERITSLIFFSLYAVFILCLLYLVLLKNRWFDIVDHIVPEGAKVRSIT